MQRKGKAERHVGDSFTANASPDSSWGGLASSEWRDLILLSYAVEPAVLAPYVPAGTVLDLYRGKAWLSLMALFSQKTRILGLPLLWQNDFSQIHLRFYVRRHAHGEQRHGSAYLNELVPNPALALMGRVLYDEHFVTVPVHHKVSLEGDQLRVRYFWKAERGWERVGVTAKVGPPKAIEEGSLEEFLAHRLWGYTTQRSGTTYEVKLSHPRWQIHPVEKSDLRLRSMDYFGEPFHYILEREPDSAFLARGSHVKIRRMHKIDLHLSQ